MGSNRASTSEREAVERKRKSSGAQTSFHFRRGRVFDDRFHVRPLKTPLEVRRALAYVLNDYRRHADIEARAHHFRFAIR